MSRRDTLPVKMGRFLKELREKRGKSQYQLSKELDCRLDHCKISRIENGRGGFCLALRTLNYLLSVYNLTPEEKMELAEILSAPG